MVQPSFPSPDTYTPPEDRSPNLKALLSYIDARNSWADDQQTLLDHFDDSLEHRILPKSLGRPVLNKKQYGEYVKGLLQFIKFYKITLHQVIETGDTMVVHAASEGVSTTDKFFRNEYMFILRFKPSEDGELPKITYVKEFVDSLSVSKFFADERSRAARR